MKYNKLSVSNVNLDYFCVDNEPVNSIFEKIHGSNNVFEWLVPSMLSEDNGEQKYIKDLIEKHISCNFPVLICGDDLDFGCTIVVVKTEYTADSVFWEKFGFVGNDENYWEKYRDSGIRNVEKWTDEDWDKYGSEAYDLLKDDRFFYDWCSKNWAEETYRRTWGYYHEYFNNDNNIEWVGELDFRFEIKEYDSFFKDFIKYCENAV